MPAAQTRLQENWECAAAEGKQYEMEVAVESPWLLLQIKMRTGGSPILLAKI